jgi:predicted DCC family thiol-disulfide oxidoreductase YuxK
MIARVLTVFYDAECGVCRLTSLTLARLDWGRRLAFVALQASPGTSPTRRDLAHELHVRDEAGRWWRGGAAALRVAAVVPVLVPIALLGRLPGVPGLVDAAYRIVAARRPSISRALRLEGSARRLRLPAISRPVERSSGSR